MALEIHVVARTGPLPTLRWQWDAETDILSGSIGIDAPGGGYTGTVELNDDDGSIVVLDIGAGVLRGLDIVVWPEISKLPGLAAPVDAREGRVVMPARAAKRGVASLELDTTLTVTSDPTERTFHLRIGTRRPVEPVRIADCFLVEVDSAQRLAGFWLERVPARDAPHS